jgi:arsenical pump membrane protein
MVFSIAAIAMVLVGVRPWRIPAWVWPALGTLAVVALGAESAGAVVLAIGQQWNVLLFILGLMGLAAAAEESGAFTWITDVLLERARGSRRRLFVLLFLAGAVLTLVLSNDATAIVLTPIVYRAIAKRGGDAMPFLFACTFIADTASFGLPFANPANVLILPHAQLIPYLLHLGPPQIVAIAVNLALFLLIFRSKLRGRYEFAIAQPPPAAALRTLSAMAGVGIAYMLALALHWPLGPVAVIGAGITLAVAFVPPRTALRHVSWSTFALLAGLFALLDAVARAGLVTWALHVLEGVSHFGGFALDATAAAGAALFSNLLNNLPVAIASSYVVMQAPTEHLAYPLIVGVDLGPNLTTTGSLATMLWLSVLRDRGTHVSAFEYLKLGVVIVPATIAVTVLWLWLVP